MQLDTKQDINQDIVDKCIHYYNRFSSFRQDGKEWYDNALMQCIDIANQSNLGTDKVCKILATLSPSVSWEQNLKDCLEVCLKNTEHNVSTYDAQYYKAIGILFDNLDKPTGQKVNSFYKNIVGLDDDSTVTIDRHILTFLGIDKASLSPKQYDLVRKSMVEASRLLGIKPKELQATLWLIEKEIKNDCN